MRYIEAELTNGWFRGGEILKNTIEAMGVTTQRPFHKIKVSPSSIWEESYETDVYYIDDVLDDIYKDGWEYKSTYWKGGSAGNAHPVMCFIKK